jgi:hypothetical protein
MRPPVSRHPAGRCTQGARVVRLVVDRLRDARDRAAVAVSVPIAAAGPSALAIVHHVPQSAPVLWCQVVS